MNKCKCKITALLVSLLTIFSCISLALIEEYSLLDNLTKFCLYYFVILIVFLLTCFIDYIVKYFSYYDLIDINNNNCDPCVSLCHKYVSCVWLIFSPGYYFSKIFKENLISDNIVLKNKHLGKGMAKAKLIKCFNHCNLIISSIILLILFLYCLHINFTFPDYEFFLYIIIGLIVYRVISRSIEIIYAFVKDAISGDCASSSLNKFDRIGLALNSYIENIINYASLYILVDGYKAPLGSLLNSVGVSTLYDSNSFECSSNLLCIAVYGQVITSLVLVVLSLAVYVSREN